MPPTADRPASSPRPDLFGHLAPPLLRLGEVETLFCDRLGINRTSYFESVRPWLPVVYTRMVPIRGERGRYRMGSPRLRADIAAELVAVAEAGLWPEYADGSLRDQNPHLYLTQRQRRAAA